VTFRLTSGKDLVLSYFLIQGLAIDAQNLGGLTLIAAAIGQHS
jgi:hypothetical protein